MIKNIIRGLVVVVSIVFAFLLCEKILLLKSEDGIKQIESYYLQKDDTVDVLFLGSSHVYCNINTGLLWDEFGISSFDLGGAEQPYWNSYYFMKEALKTQRPKVIVLDITIPGIRSVEYQPENWVITNLYGMNWNRNRVEATKASTLPASFNRLLFPMYSIHGRYSDLKKDDFIDENKSINYKGFDFRDNVVEYERPDITNVVEEVPMTEKEEFYFRKIIELSKQESIPLLLISVPFVVEEESQKIYNYSFRIAAEEGIEGIDFNRMYDEVGIDFSTDMADNFHLNFSGSRKFTPFLGKLLKEKYDLADHRGDERYASWEVDALNQRQEYNCFRLNDAEDLKEYLQILNNEEYVAFIICGNEVDTEYISQISQEFMEMGYEGITENSALVLSGKEILYNTTENEFNICIDEGSDKIQFERVNADNEINSFLFINEDKQKFDERCISILVYDRQLKREVSHFETSP